MGAFNFNFGTKSIKSFNTFNQSGKDDPSYVVTMDFFYKVLDEIHYMLVSTKNMSDDDADKFLDVFIAIDSTRVKEMRDIVNTCYIEKNSALECAAILMDKYYDIARNNNDFDGSIDSDDEILEKNFFHLKTASKSLFWNFFFKLKNNKINFNLDLTYVNNKSNSFNDDEYNFIIKTDSVNVDEVKGLFNNNNIFKQILDVTKDSKDDIIFYIGVTENNLLDFGYYFESNKYSIGKLKYNNYDIIKIINKSNSVYHNLAFFKFMSNFKSIIKILNHYEKILTSYLKHYGDIDIYLNIINENLCIVIESEYDDVININYINDILNDNRYTKIKRDWNIVSEITGNKTFYYISL